MMGFWDFFKTEKPMEVSDRERCKYKIEISGYHLDDLIEPPREVRFERVEYKETLEEAEKIGIEENKKGNEVEIWELVERLLM